VLNSGPVNRPPLSTLPILPGGIAKAQAVLFAPLWAQRIFVPILVLVGTILGRYRGTEWSGCLARYAPPLLANRPEELRERRATVGFA
jgi:hypothetical protein